jgi:O-antigen ligase
MVGAALDCGKERMKRAILYAIVAALAALCIALILGRSALIGVGAGLVVMLMPILIVVWRKAGAWFGHPKVLRWLLVGSIFIGVCAVAVPVSRQLYMLKPISGAGRVLIWSVAARMVMHAPFTGVGFGNYANRYNLFQAEYFAQGGGSVPQRMAADPCRHAFNEPLEVAAELGMPGLLVFTVFCGLILKEVWEVVTSKGTSVAGTPVRQCSEFVIHYSVNEEQSQEVPQRCRSWRHGADAARDGCGGTGHTPSSKEAAPTVKPDYLTLGMAGAVVCFMVMSLFHFPRKVVPTWLVFNYALAWIVTANQQCKQGVNELKRSHKTLVVMSWRMFWLLAFLASASLLPLYVKNYLAARRWIAAQEQIFAGNVCIRRVHRALSKAEMERPILCLLWRCNYDCCGNHQPAGVYPRKP